MSYDEYAQEVRVRLKNKLTELNINHKNISEILGISESNVGTFLAGKTKLDLEKIYKICQKFDISLESILITKDDINVDSTIRNISLVNLSAINPKSGILFDPEDIRIKKLIEDNEHYYFYTKPTKSDSSMSYLSGKLKFTKSQDISGILYTKVELTLYTGEKDHKTNKENVKKFSGNLLMGTGTNVCFIIVTSENIEEVNMITFNYGILYSRKLESALALCSTVSSTFNHRRTTVEKAIITAYELSNKHLCDLDMLLSINYSDFYVCDDVLKEHSEINDLVEKNVYYKLSKKGVNKLKLLENCDSLLEKVPFLRISRDDDDVLHEYIETNVIRKSD